MYSFLGYTVLPWQEYELRALYGRVNPSDGTRQHRTGYIEVPKKNGKTFLVGGLPIYHLVLEDVRKPEAYGSAATKEQAGLVYKAAIELIEANPVLSKRLRPLKSIKRILQRDGQGFYQVLSGDGKGTDGVEPSLVIKDEVHRWTGGKAETLWQVLSKGQISRDEPLEVRISTAGAEDESLLWNQERDFAKGVIAGEFDAPSYYASIYQADEKRVSDEVDYWKTREARVAANPSHEDNGGFLKDSALVEEVQKAQARHLGINDYLRYHLGIRVSSTQEAVIDMARWQASGSAGAIDLREWPVYDYELLIRKWGVVDTVAFGGIDASWSTDLTAVSLLFPPTDTCDRWRTMVWYLMPAGKVQEMQTKDNVPYVEWVEKGYISTCPGNTVDYQLIQDRVVWASKLFNLREVGYDPWNLNDTAGRLVNDGVRMAAVRQDFAHLSHATKTLIGCYSDNKLEHCNNPVLNFNARSLALQWDRKDNVQPAKPERFKTKKRIDGMAATIIAMSRGIEYVKAQSQPGVIFI